MENLSSRLGYGRRGTFEEFDVLRLRIYANMSTDDRLDSTGLIRRED